MNFANSLNDAYNDFFSFLQKTVHSFVNNRYPIFLNFNSIDIGRNIAFSFALQKFDSVFDGNSFEWEHPIDKVLHLFVGNKNVNQNIADVKAFPIWLCGDDSGGWWVRDDFAFLEYNSQDIIEILDNYVTIGFKRNNDYMQIVVMNDESGTYESKQEIELSKFTNKDLTIFSCFVFIPISDSKREKSIAILKTLFTKYSNFKWIIIDEKKFNYSNKTENLNCNLNYLKHINLWSLNYSYYLFDSSIFNSEKLIPNHWLR